jgi:hypothetical protein
MRSGIAMWFWTPSLQYAYLILLFWKACSYQSACDAYNYAIFLVRRFDITHLAKGVKEVHVFDIPTTKWFEQSRQDAEHLASSDSVTLQMTLEMALQMTSEMAWLLKRSRVQTPADLYLWRAFLSVVLSLFFFADQTIVVAGCYADGKVMCVSVSRTDEYALLICNNQTPGSGCMDCSVVAKKLLILMCITLASHWQILLYMLFIITKTEAATSHCMWPWPFPGKTCNTVCM